MTGLKNNWDYSCGRYSKSPDIKYFQILNGQISEPHCKVFFVTWLNNLNYGHPIVRYSEVFEFKVYLRIMAVKVAWELHSRFSPIPTFTLTNMNVS